MSPGARQQKLSKFRVVCRDDAEQFTLRAKAKDKYEAFEQVILFLRSRGFDYQVVLIEPS